MAFDLSTAQPAQSGGFDLSTAKSAAPEIQEATQEPRVVGRAGRAQRIRQDQPEPVGPQELAILEYLASGHSIKQAHNMLGISQQEIEADTISIIAKLTTRVDA